MKKIISLTLCITMILSIFVGCSSTDKEAMGKTQVINGYTVNNEYDRLGLKTIDGEAFVVNENPNTFLDKYSGIGFTMSDTMVKEREKEFSKISGFVSTESIGFVYYSESVNDILPNDEDASKMSQEEIAKIYEKIMQYEFDLFAVIRDDKSPENTEYITKLKSNYSNLEELLTFDNSTFYFAYNDNYEGKILTEKEKEQVDIFISDMKEMKNGLCIFKAVEQEENVVFKGSLVDFMAKTMSGKEIDQSIFGNYDITMVNLWATWCGYCVEELPDLQRMYEQLPENVNIISICTDASEEKELVQKMIEEMGIRFETIIDSEDLKEKFYKYAEAMPTTVFVDKFGNVIGDVQTGLPGEDVVAGYTKLLEDALEIIGK